MNKKEKNKHLISKETPEETEVSSAPVDSYVPDSDEHYSHNRVKRKLWGGGSASNLEKLFWASISIILFISLCRDFSYFYLFLVLNGLYFYFRR